MKISFLVTYYNQKKYVADSLNSILAIKKPCDWEILVGDDGSSDGTIEAVQKYMEKYPDNIKLFVMPRDVNKKYDAVKRASANRLNILGHAAGDLFCTLDGDDYYCDIDFIEEAVEIYQNNMDVSIVAFGYKCVAGEIEGKANTLSVEAGIGRIDKKKYLSSFYLPAGACVYRRMWGKDRIEYIKKIGYFDDNDILINSLNYGEMYSVGRVIYAYRQTGVSVYTSMNAVEQAVLNVQGFDVDVKLISGEYKDTLLQRNAASIITMYVWRKQLRKILGEDKYNRYLAGCREIEDSLAYKLFMYGQVNKSDKLKQNDLIIKVMKRNQWKTVKIYLKKIMKKI